MHTQSLDGRYQTCKGMDPEASSLQLLKGCRGEAWHSVLEEPLFQMDWTIRCTGPCRSRLKLRLARRFHKQLG